VKTRRGKNIQLSKLLQGPGNFSKGLGIDINLNGVYLNKDQIWIEDVLVIKKHIEEVPRVGISYAGEDALLPWRYILKDN
jgi:DNA-3-methyladenine glycosylase